MALSTFVKEFFGRVQLVMKSSAASQVDVLAETDGTPKVSNYGKASGTLTAFKLETTGEQDFVLHGKDSGGTIDPLRTNDNQQLFSEPYEQWEIVAPVELGGSDTSVYSPGVGSGRKFLLKMFAYNFTAGTVNLTVAVDVTSGGSIGNNEYLANAEPLPAKTRLPFDEILIGGNYAIRAFAGAANSINLHFKVKEVGRT